ncbi:MAG: hypothetical protein AAFS10_24825 [Myxococcota bacterium]
MQGWLLLSHAGSTLFMTGLIWVIQVVHYPLFAGVGAAQFQAYHHEHTRLITLIVGPVMLVELVSSVMLLAFKPEAVPAWLVWLGVVLVVVAWGSTAMLQVPAHNALASGLDPKMHGFLVHSNWLRTAAWTVRGALALWMIAMLMPPEVFTLSE